MEGQWEGPHSACTSRARAGSKCHFLKQIMEEVGGTILGHQAPTQLGNILRATFILREICHNSEAARCAPPVVGSFPGPLGHPVKHGDVRSLSYLGRRRFALRRRRERKDLEREPTEPNGAPRLHPSPLNGGAPSARVRSGAPRQAPGPGWESFKTQILLSRFMYPGENFIRCSKVKEKLPFASFIW